MLKPQALRVQWSDQNQSIFLSLFVIDSVYLILPSADCRMQRRRYSSLLLSVGMMLLFSNLALCDGVFLKTSVFWRSLNGTNQRNGSGRRLHDYLSLFPTYGDSKKLGSLLFLEGSFIGTITLWSM